MASENPRRASIRNIMGNAPNLSKNPTPLPHDLYSNNHATASSWWEANWAINVFTDAQLKKRVPKSVYKAYKSAVKEHKKIDDTVADVIANAMKDWAVERGATHFTHWFQPIHIATAEKHDSFFQFTGDGKTLLEFTGGELIRGEPDASSFPNGGIRSTYEARGYTSWDPSSPAFIRYGHNGATLCIPTVFCSWTGEALDVKTPLLRSIDCLSTQCTRLLKLIGDEKVKSVNSTLGPEQEFFIVDRNFYLQRPDLMTIGRTVIGAKPPKGQEMEDHYFARIHSRVLAYIQEVEQELWRLGIPTRTRHNEVAPGQHEMAPIFEYSNLATDHNMIEMELMREIANKHHFACLLHEKPFKGVNGSGKHNNYSMATDYNLNLLEPTDKPELNTVFQVFLAATIRAVDVHQDLLRVSIANPGNDFRLGANEAPPAIMSVYLGSEIGELVSKLISDKGDGTMPQLAKQPSILVVAQSVAPFRRDRTDRNRTSPFAFTGNKFEFRAVGSSQNIGLTCMVLNIIVADSARYMADEVEKLLNKNVPRDKAVKEVIVSTLKQHQRILFDGNNYSPEWVAEAEKRGLCNLRECVGALEQFASPKNIQLFRGLGVLSPNEVESRKNISFEHYSNTTNIEAQVAISMVQTQVIPVAVQYQERLAHSISAAKEILKTDFAPQEELLAEVTKNINGLLLSIKKLQANLKEGKAMHNDNVKRARYYRDNVKAPMEELRMYSDTLEEIVPDDLWTIPKYHELLFLK